MSTAREIIGLPMVLARIWPGAWIEIGGMSGGGTAFAYWDSKRRFWNDGADYRVTGTWWRPARTDDVLGLPPPPAKQGG